MNQMWNGTRFWISIGVITSRYISSYFVIFLAWQLVSAVLGAFGVNDIGGNQGPDARVNFQFKVYKQIDYLLKLVCDLLLLGMIFRESVALCYANK